MNIIETHALGKSYGQTKALHDCTLAIPEGHVVALVGPNGAGKTTLLNLAVGLAVPTSGEVTVLGGRPAGSPAALDGIAFVAQNTPLYKNLSAADLIHETRNLNRRFDQGYADQRLDELGIPLRQKAGEMSGGQQAQLALTLALARRPQLLVLDEPMASLDPLARIDFMATVMAAVADDGLSVVLSSHILADLERVCDYLVLLRAGASRWSARSTISSPTTVSSPARSRSTSATRNVERRARQPRCVAGAFPRSAATAPPTPVPPGWEARPITLEELNIAYLREPDAAALPGLRRGGAPIDRSLRNDRARRARLSRRGRPSAASPLATNGLGHMAASPGRAGRRGGLSRTVGLWLWATGLSLHHEFAAAAACRPVGSANCVNLAVIFDTTNGFLKGGFLLQPIPALIGAFVGPVVLAREFETGTFRYAWTQGIGRWRWTVAKLVVLGVAVAALAGAFSMLLSWYYQPYVAAQSAPNVGGASPLSAGLFDLRGVAFAAWTLVAFSIGVLAGMLIRRIVPAIVATLAAYAALALVTANVLRLHYLAPLVAKNLHIPRAAWIIGEWWTKGGKVVFGSRIELGLLPQLCPASFSAGRGGGVTGFGNNVSPEQCLLRARLHGMGQLPAPQSILALPMDRVGLAACAVRAACRRDRLARTPSSGMKAQRSKPITLVPHRRIYLNVLSNRRFVISITGPWTDVTS